MNRLPALFALLLTPTLLLQAATLTVNTTNTSNARDGVLSLTEAILLANGPALEGISLNDLDSAEQAQVSGTLGESDLIAFDIPGDGPHLLIAPEGNGDGGFPAVRSNGLVIDGYTQPGSSPNTNSMHEPNNAVLQIVLDGRNGGMNNLVYAILGTTAEDVVFRGLSVLDQRGGDFGGGAGLSFINGTPLGLENALGGRIEGCWIGIHPDGTTVAGGELGAYFGGEVGETRGGHIIGTNGDGVNDRAEFNVIGGYGENIYSDGAPDVRISGNRLGILPDGVTPANPSPTDKGIEGIQYHRSLIGTDSDGIADEDEANHFGGLNQGIHIWGGVVFDLIVAGNVFGVAIDGTPLPLNRWVEGHVWVNSRFGSDLDGVRDEVEANVVENVSEFLFEYNNSIDVENDARASIRGNQFRNNVMAYSGFENSYLAFNTGLDETEARPVIDAQSTTAQLSGTVPLHADNADAFANISAIYLDVYLADEASLPENPQGAQYLATYVVDGPEDLDPAAGSFSFSIDGLLTQAGSAFLTATASYEGGITETFYADTYIDLLETPRGIDTSPFSLAHEVTSTSVRDWSLF